MNSPTQDRPGHTGTRLTRIAVTTAMVLASMGAAITVAKPAHATVVRNSVPALAGTVAQSATATCPNNQFLSGAGGGVTGGGGDVTLTDVIPNLATRSVTVWAHTNSPVMPAYTVGAEAICVPGPAPANHVLVSNTTGPNAVVNKSVVATCPAGTQLLGTGYEMNQAFGKAFPRWIYPNFALTTNTVVADATGALVGNPWQLTAHAICGTPPAGVAPSRLGNGGVVNPASPKTTSTIACPAGTRTTGVGSLVAPGPAVAGFVLINGISANLGQDVATTSAVEGNNPGAGVAWHVDAYNICW